MGMSQKVVRVYVREDAYSRLKRYAARYNAKLYQALTEVILTHIDDDGQPVKNAIWVDDRTMETLTTLAAREGKSASELIRMLCEMAETYFSEDLTLADALRPVSEIKEIIEKKSRGHG